MSSRGATVRALLGEAYYCDWRGSASGLCAFKICVMGPRRAVVVS